MKKKRSQKTVEAGTDAENGLMVADAPVADDGIDGAPLVADDAADTDMAEAVPGQVTNESIVEAILFATDSPLPPAKIAQVMGTGDARSVRKHVQALNDRYEKTGASFRIDEIAGGFQMLTLPAYNAWLGKVNQVRREGKLSGAALETLAVVAYKQPVLRADIESIRGVAVGEVVNRLREAGLVKIVGRAEIIGRPLLYGTTKKFLETFGLASLDDLPKVDALSPPVDQTRAVDPDRLPDDNASAGGSPLGDPSTDESATEPMQT